jgi:hypothetical protein
MQKELIAGTIERHHIFKLAFLAFDLNHRSKKADDNQQDESVILEKSKAATDEKGVDHSNQSSSNGSMSNTASSTTTESSAKSNKRQKTQTDVKHNLNVSTLLTPPVTHEKQKEQLTLKMPNFSLFDFETLSPNKNREWGYLGGGRCGDVFTGTANGIKIALKVTIVSQWCFSNLSIIVKIAY